MNDQMRNAMARALLGNSMAGQAADMTNLRAQYDMLVSDGVEMPPFQEWAAMQQTRQPNQGMNY